MSYFSTNLRFLREQRKLSQNKLAEYIKTSQANINRWEDGSISPGIDKVDSIADYFNIPISMLLGEDLRLIKFEEIEKNEFETIAKDWIKSTNKTPEEKQKFLRELARLVDEEEK